MGRKEVRGSVVMDYVDGEHPRKTRYSGTDILLKLEPLHEEVDQNKDFPWEGD